MPPGTWTNAAAGARASADTDTDPAADSCKWHANGGESFAASQALSRISRWFIGFGVSVFVCVCVCVQDFTLRLPFFCVCCVQAAICMTIGMIGNPDVDFLSWAVNWGVAYDLPNREWVIQHAHGLNATLSKEHIQRRSRRAFYDEVRSIFNNMGFNGHSCVARALCESARLMLPQGQRGNMLQELVRTVFSLPATPVAVHEPQAHHQYDRIYRRSKRSARECHEIYPDCQFSLLALALGKYMGATTTKLSAFNFM
ncbi:Hypothetical predicted protein [Drosophila guanche]|uniref:Uncharacterized protein n=1 Tax=Drosophila guanche TaxID=7266 RepID=A0A3B0JM17_DROGU|nr:Hypothetical predicted protein [Drosophila guanche]